MSNRPDLQAISRRTYGEPDNVEGSGRTYSIPSCSGFTLGQTLPNISRTHTEGHKTILNNARPRAACSHDPPKLVNCS